jgi:hypothetical protein
MSPSQFVQLDDGLWTVAAPLKALGLAIGTRMTIVRLANGELWLHSPIRPTAEIREAIDALGPVRYIVAPNLFHHMFAGEAAAAWPEARLFGPKGLAKKRKDLVFAGFLEPDKPGPWAPELEEIPLAGTLLKETMFLHPATRTLITSDLAANCMHATDWFTRLYIKASRVGERFGLSLTLRACYRNKPRARASIQTLLEKDFDRVIVAHGDVLERGGRAEVAQAFDWLLKS